MIHVKTQCWRRASGWNSRLLLWTEMTRYLDTKTLGSGKLLSFDLLNANSVGAKFTAISTADTCISLRRCVPSNYSLHAIPRRGLRTRVAIVEGWQKSWILTWNIMTSNQHTNLGLQLVSLHIVASHKQCRVTASRVGVETQDWKVVSGEQGSNWLKRIFNVEIKS